MLPRAPSRLTLLSRSVLLTSFFYFILFFYMFHRDFVIWKQNLERAPDKIAGFNRGAIGARFVLFDAVLVCGDNGFRKRTLIKNKKRRRKRRGKGSMKNIVVTVREWTRQRDALPAFASPMGWTINGKISCLVSMKVASNGIWLCTLESKNSCHSVGKITFATVFRKG